ncbi:hypothetical protein Bbelb_138300 [Branchiostoma belcheri]|nr:hypothetical protein Bbelb_138300 [Branchiostoma belcheri]
MAEECPPDTVPKRPRSDPPVQTSCMQRESLDAGTRETTARQDDRHGDPYITNICDDVNDGDPYPNLTDHEVTDATADNRNDVSENNAGISAFVLDYLNMRGIQLPWSALYQNPMFEQNTQNPDLVYSQNAMSPNPTYAPSADNTDVECSQNVSDSDETYESDVCPEPAHRPATTDSDCNPRTTPLTAVSAEADTGPSVRPKSTFTPTNNDLHIKPYAIRYQGDGENGILEGRGTPYAVRYQEDDEDDIIDADGNRRTRPDDVDTITPYAVARMSQYDMTDERRRDAPMNDGDTSASHRNMQRIRQHWRALQHQGVIDPTTMRNALNQNPMYVPNIPQQAARILSTTPIPTHPACCSSGPTEMANLSTMRAKVETPTNNARDATLSPTSSSSEVTSDATAVTTTSPITTPFVTKTSVTTTFITTTFDTTTSSTNFAATKIPTTSKMSSYQTTMSFDTTRIEVSTGRVITTTIHKGSHGKIVKPEKITLGGKGKSPGQFNYPRGVAMSVDSEIYVADIYNRRVQVFNKNGAFLRFFKTVHTVPGKTKRTIAPYDVAIDAKGFIWVAGVVRINGIKVVKYSQSGQQIFTIAFTASAYTPTIAANAPNNNIVVAAKPNFIFVLRPDGSLYKRFQLVRGVESGYVAFSNEGNILFTDVRSQAVQVYTQDGGKLFQFGGKGSGEGQLRIPTGICTDSSGHIFVSNRKNKRIDMFTSRGKFVRTVVRMKSPWGLACGPDRQLVVTDVRSHTITIIPRELVLL